MKTSLDCIPCFFKQIVDTSKIAGADDKLRLKMIERFASVVGEIDMSLTPTEISRVYYTMINEMSGVEDPYKKIKKESNDLALKLYPELKKIVEKADDKILCALKLTLAGNTIDYGAKSHPSVHKDGVDLQKEIEKMLSISLNSSNSIFEYKRFKSALDSAGDILYICDNAGEIVFDRVFVEGLKGKDVTFVVKSKPIINDATLEDALYCGLDKAAPVIESGSDISGTLLSKTTKEFQQMFNKASLIISKGQGNFETLCEIKGKPIFFVFKIKCPVVAQYLGYPVGTVIVKGT